MVLGFGFWASWYGAGMLVELALNAFSFRNAARSGSR